MRNSFKAFGVFIFIALLMYLSTIHNDTNAAAPYSNISTSRISTGFLLKTNDYGTNESFVSFTYFIDVNSNLFAFFNGSNFVFVSAGLTTNVWGGPTNVIDYRTNHYTYYTLTSVYIQGITNQALNYAWNPTLKIVNASGSNINITLAAGIRAPIGDILPYVLTNNDTWIGSFDLSDGQTNMMAKEWHQ